MAVVYASNCRDSLRRRTRCLLRFPPLALTTGSGSVGSPKTFSIGGMEGCKSIAIVGLSVGRVVEKLFPKIRFGRAEMFLAWAVEGEPF